MGSHRGPRKAKQKDKEEKGSTHISVPKSVLSRWQVISSHTGISMSKIAEQGLLMRLAELEGAIKAA